MNKKISYIFGLLVLGLFVISACQQDTVGRNIVDKGIQQEAVERCPGGVCPNPDEGIGARQLDDFEELPKGVVDIHRCCARHPTDLCTDWKSGSCEGSCDGGPCEGAELVL